MGKIKDKKSAWNMFADLTKKIISKPKLITKGNHIQPPNLDIQ